LEAITERARQENQDITPRAIYSRIESVKKEFGNAISIRMAANVLASRMKIDVHAILRGDENELRELRELLRAAPLVTVAPIARERRDEKGQVITIGKKIIDTFGLPPNLANEADRMAEIYPMMFVLENLMRHVVMNVLTDAYGSNWWNQPNAISNDIKRDVERRKSLEGANRWHHARGSHEIFYTNFGDLSSIVSTNWSHFKPLFNKLGWIQAKLEEVELSRNIIAHNNPLPKREFDRIELCLGDLKRQLNDFIEKQPK
jgi:hypothetical protein